MTDCIFCKIVNKEIKGNIVHQDEHVTAFRDVNPRAPLHVLVVPNEHIGRASDLTEVNAHLIGKMVLVANKVAAEEGVVSSGYRMVINNGPGAGQSVFHIHIHLLGGRNFTWPPG